MCQHGAMSEQSRQFYARPGRFTALDAGAPHPEGLDLRSEVAAIVDLVQGLLIYDVVAEPFYGVALPAEQADAIHERDTQRLLDLALSVDPRPLEEARPPAHRVGARCHAFSRVTVAFLRSAGIPARARCGFGTYFRPGWYEDHWVAEYWDAKQGRWQMIEAQLDEVWREKIGFTGDPMAITDEQFVTAGHAWQAWRRGELDADRCGLSAIEEHGAFWIAANLRLDLASLNKVEMLPWDLWGEGWEAGEEPTQKQLELFDFVARLTVDPDAHFLEIRALYKSHDGLRMNGKVFTVARNCYEAV